MICDSILNYFAMIFINWLCTIPFNHWCNELHRLVKVGRMDKPLFGFVWTRSCFSNVKEQTT